MYNTGFTVFTANRFLFTLKVVFVIIFIICILLLMRVLYWNYLENFPGGEFIRIIKYYYYNMRIIEKSVMY